MSRLSPQEVAKRLGGAKQNGEKWTALCPAHDDRNPSLSLDTAPDGSLLAHCHAGCSQDAVIAELKNRDLWPRQEKVQGRSSADQQWSLVCPVPSDAPQPDFKALCRAKPEAIYTYLNVSGQLLGYQCRMATKDGKRFAPITYWKNKNGAFKWRSEWLPTPRPLYGLHHLAHRPNAPVLIAEGEKAADAAAKLFPAHVVVTWSNGANAVGAADWNPLKGRRITIWPDNDDPGQKAALDVAARLKAIGVLDAKIVQLPKDLPAKWDLADDVPTGLDLRHLLDTATSIDTTYASYILTARELLGLPIEPRASIIVPFLAVGALMMLYAIRGVGKTWLALVLALAVARGHDFLAYKVAKARTVLYVDGEMPIASLRERLEQLGGSPPDNLLFLTSEKLALGGQSLNINNTDHQKRLNETLDRLEMEGRKPELIILDNMSSLGGGIDENDNSALDVQLTWLTNLRFRGYSVLIVHHAGKSGDQRGASRREDLLDTTIKLVVPSDDDVSNRIGATFELSFTKARGIMPEPSKLLLSLRENAHGQLEFQFENVTKKITPYLRTLLTIAKGMMEKDGNVRPYRTQDELAARSGLSKAAISKHIQKLRVDGLFVQRGTALLVTEDGAEAAEQLSGVKVPHQLIDRGFLDGDLSEPPV